MKIRYEEYSNAAGLVPFILSDNIKRTPLLYSESQNWHENIEIQYCHNGEGFVRIDGMTHEFGAGDIALIDSSSIHYTYSHTDMTYSCIIVRTEFCKQMGIDHSGLSFTPILRDDRVSCLFERILMEYRRESNLRVARLNKLLLELLIAIVDNYSVPKNKGSLRNKEIESVKLVLLFIRENFSSKITLDDISRAVFVDKYTLCKIFKKITGQTVFENLNAYRCMRAFEYITEGKSISESAMLSGFENNSFFTKTYKRYMGILPSKTVIHNRKTNVIDIGEKK